MDDDRKDPLTDPGDYILDLSSMRKPQDSGAAESSDSQKQSAQCHGPVGPDGKPAFISVFFQCCHAYARFYRTRDGAAYAGRCPKCMRQGAVAAVDVGKDDRMFVAG